MNRTIEAIFENGVFRPTEPVQLAEGLRVSVTVPDGKTFTQGSYDAEAVNRALDELAALPMEGPDDEFSGADHDKILYSDPHD